jgi:hypothetical protein
MGIKVEGMHAKEAMQAVAEGKFDEVISAGKTELTAEELKAQAEEQKAMQAELEENHAKMEAEATDILEQAGGDVQKARKLKEEAAPQ